MQTHLLAALLIALAAIPAYGQPVPALTPPTGNPVPESAKPIPEKSEAGAEKHSLTKADIDAWLDGYFPYALQRADIAGAVVVVVKDGETLVEKGYGYCDVAARKPVDPQKTLFRAGSVSKLFTWTAVMQLVEQGKIDLDADINTYLDYKVPGRGGKPITMRNLMTHTAGFDESIRALLVNNPKDLHSLGDTLKRWIPPRVTDPGTTPAYSNYGAAVAGYIVERLSGQSFDDYIEQHIFQPLGMKYASFRQPLPKELEPFMSKGYKLASGDPKPFEIITIAPAGSLSISGADMARFMNAHLQNGGSGSNRILKEETAVKMHTTGFPIIPPLHTMMLGFYQTDINGHRVITHAGDTEWFHSELNLFLDENIGMYLSVNSPGKEGAAGQIRSMLFQQFADRYFPAPRSSGEVDAETAKKHAQLMAGRYVLSRRAHNDFISLINLFGQVPVVAKKDGTISVAALKGPEGQPKKWQEIAPLVWRDSETGERLAAKVENNRVTRFGYDPYPFMIFEPVEWWWSSAWLMPLCIVALIALALTVLAWPISALVRRHYGVAYGLKDADARAHRMIRVGSLLVLVMALLWMFTITKMLGDFAWVAPGMDTWVVLLRILSFVLFLAGAVMALWNVYLVLRSQRRWPAKVWSLVLAVSCLTLVYIAFVFHLVGYTANY
jgi:CubicO group peptidase (beta-lactamase class C family)